MAVSVSKPCVPLNDSVFLAPLCQCELPRLLTESSTLIPRLVRVVLS